MKPFEDAVGDADTVVPSPETVDALDVARAMASFGVPIFVAPPNPRFGAVRGDGTTDARMFIEPRGWQRSKADRSIVDDWRPGWLLAAVTGVGFDVIDTDPRNGGTASRAAVREVMPTVFGVAETQRGGRHELIARLHRGKRSGSAELLPGLDILAGDDEGRGRSYVRLAPTRTPLGDYRWVVKPDLEGLAEGDPGGVERFVTQFYDPLTARQNEYPPGQQYDGHELSLLERVYLVTALESERSATASAVQGGRNTRLLVAAFNLGQLVAGAGLPESDVVDRLTAAGLEAGLGDAETQATLASGLEAGKRRPRGIPVAAREAEVGAREAEVGEQDDTDLVDLVALLEGVHRVPDPPTLLRLEGGGALLYPRRLNALIGEPESAKSWLALVAAAEVLRSAGSVTYIDLEDSPHSMLERLVLLGVDRDCLARLQYSQPSDRAGLRHRLSVACAQVADLVVIDSMGAFLSILGADSLSNDDVNGVAHTYLHRLTDAGSCVLYLDHVTKSRDHRGRYPLGAQSKLANISGACYAVETLTPLGRGRSGRLKISVTKDRLGHVRGQTGSGNVVAIATVVSTDDSVIVTLESDGRNAEDPWRPTVLMRHVSEYLESQDDPVSQRQIEEAVTGKTTFVRKAVRQLVSQGYAEAVPAGQHPKFRSLKAFRT